MSDIFGCFHAGSLSKFSFAESISVYSGILRDKLGVFESTGRNFLRQRKWL
jgi:hypothetical protein